MKVSVIAILIIVGQCQSFLGETATPPSLEDTLAPVEDSLSLIAKKYEKDLSASGDCVIVFSKCNFQGSAQKICNEPNSQLSFELPISSVYVPFGQQITISDKIEGNTITFLLSQKCLLQSIVAEISVTETGEYSKESDGMPLMKQQRFLQNELPDQSEIQKKIEKDAEEAAIYNTPTEIKIDANVEITVPEVKEPEVTIQQDEKKPKGGLSPVQPEADADSKVPKGDLSLEKPPKGGVLPPPKSEDLSKAPKGDNGPEPLTGNK